MTTFPADHPLADFVEMVELPLKEWDSITVVFETRSRQIRVTAIETEGYIKAQEQDRFGNVFDTKTFPIAYETTHLMAWARNVLQGYSPTQKNHKPVEFS